MMRTRMRRLDRAKDRLRSMTPLLVLMPEGCLYLITGINNNTGRLAAQGFLSDVPFASKYRDTASSSTNAVRPEEALFRRLNAPIRYEETDFYFAHEKLPSNRPLPNTDLLESVHAYSSDFYEHATPDGGRGDYQSMDETALIAMGVLLEEMAKEALGKTGDLVLVEGEEILDDNERWRSQRSRSRKRESTVASSGDDLESVVRRKRRRMVSRAPSGADTDGEEKLRAG